MSDETASDPHAQSLDALAEDFAARLRAGGRPTIAEYVERRPDLSAAIRSLFPMLEEIEAGAPPRQAAPTSPLAEIGDCRIIREIGRGGMGIVYEAEQLSLGRRVALKVLPTRFTDPMHRKRFEREARTAAKLHHSNIVPVFSVGEHDGSPYFTMQLISGQSLDKVIVELRDGVPGTSDGAASTISMRLEKGEWEAAADSDEPSVVNPPSSAGGSSLSPSGRNAAYWRRIAALGVQAADALEYAHRQSILHRDVKPSNLILDANGTLWVTDLGLARDAGQNDLTKTGDVVGTLRYLPPEALSGKVDARSDVYSLGLTLYELIALRPAFDALDRAVLLKDLTEREPPSLARIVPDAPRDLAVVVQLAMEKDPARRYATAEEFRADLQRFIDDEPVQARSASAVYRLQKFVRRNRVPVFAGAAVVVTLTAGIVGTTVGMLRASDRAEGERLAKIEAQGQKLAALAAAEAEKAAKLKTEKRLTQIERGADLLASVFNNLDPRTVEKEDRPLRELIAEQLDKTVGQLDGDAIADEATTAKLQHALGVSYKNLGYAARGIPLLERALQTRKRILGMEDNVTLMTANSLGSAYAGDGKSELALSLLGDTLKRRVALLGATHPDTLRTRNNLALAKYAAGDVEGAIPLFAEAFKGLRSALGENDQDVLTIENNLASAYAVAGKLDLAIPMLITAHLRSIKKYGLEHAETCTTANNLAAAWLAAEKFDKAVELAKSTLKVQTKILGADNAATLASANTLATIYFRMGRLSDSIPLFEDALPRLQRVLGPNHPDVLSTTANLGINYIAARRFKEGISMMETASERAGKNPSLAWIRENLQDSYVRAGRIPEAAKMTLDDVAEARKRLPHDGPEFKRVLGGAGDLLVRIGAFDAAENILREYLAGCVRDASKTPPLTPQWKVAYARTLYGAALLGQKKYTQSEQELRMGYEGLKRDWKQMPEPSRRPALGNALRRRIECAVGDKQTSAVAELKKEQAWLDRQFPASGGR